LFLRTGKIIRTSKTVCGWHASIETKSLLGFSNCRFIEKVSLMCNVKNSSTDCDNLSFNDNGSPDDEDGYVSEPVEQWSKSSPQISNKTKTGKYLSLTQTKLKFKPMTMKGTANPNAKEKLNCSSNEFKEF
jgi:hypothetical protein